MIVLTKDMQIQLELSLKHFQTQQNILLRIQDFVVRRVCLNQLSSSIQKIIDLKAFNYLPTEQSYNRTTYIKLDSQLKIPKMQLSQDQSNPPQQNSQIITKKIVKKGLTSSSNLLPLLGQLYNEIINENITEAHSIKCHAAINAESLQINSSEQQGLVGFEVREKVLHNIHIEKSLSNRPGEQKQEAIQNVMFRVLKPPVGNMHQAGKDKHQGLINGRQQQICSGVDYQPIQRRNGKSFCGQNGLDLPENERLKNGKVQYPSFPEQIFLNPPNNNYQQGVVEQIQPIDYEQFIYPCQQYSGQLDKTFRRHLQIKSRK